MHVRLAEALAAARSAADSAAGEKRARVEFSRGAAAALRALVEGDLTARPDPPELAGEFEAARTLYGKTVFAMACSAAAVVQRARDIARESETLGVRARREEVRLEQGRAALREATAAIGALLDERRRTIESAAATVEAASTALKAGAKSQGRVGAFAERIETAAAQTCILALNLGVEAARAGESGRAIAVIAKELRTLALRSSDTARELAQALVVAAPRLSVDPPPLGSPPPDPRDLFDAIEAALNGARFAREAQAAEAIRAGAGAIEALAEKLSTLARHFRLPDAPHAPSEPLPAPMRRAS